MQLKDFIEQYGDNVKDSCEKLAKKFYVTPRAVESWYYHQRYPSVETARIIVRTTKGKVDYEGIYAPYTESDT